MKRQKSKILMFGGLGFIGKHLTNKLLNLEHEVTLVEINLANRNLEKASKIKNLKIIAGDILDKEIVGKILKGKYDVLYNLAAHSGPKASVDYPFLDLETNVLGSLNILEEAKRYPEMKIVFLGSRLEYGESRELPVNEEHVSTPQSIYGLSKFTSSKYYILYNKLFGLNTIVIRGANPYGPHIYNPNPSYNIINYFIDKAIRSETIEIFENAKNQIKDYIYIDDFCEALSKIPFSKNSYGKIFNLGSGEGIKFITAVKSILKIVKKGKFVVVNQDKTLNKLEAGNYISDIKKIKSVIDWYPKTSFVEGVEKTINFKGDTIFEI